uniref:C-type lectin domain-containing protein n=2 Tax=Caenorhabditis japonica TaxID=281687 RepID=A0A8R1E285_CAEJA
MADTMEVDTITMEITMEPVCEDGWKFFERPSGGWCIKSFANGIMTKYAAEAKCNVLDATVSGLQNKAEIDYIESQLSVLIAGLRGSAWIGGTRINSCIGKPMGGECTPSTAFTWTDKSATGTDGLWWNDRQPDNFKLIQDCMVLSNAEVPVVWSGGASWVSGRLDDLACDDFAVAYVCGKRPTLK